VTSVFRSPSRLVCSDQREAIVKKLVALAGLLVLAGALGVVLASRGSDKTSSPGPQPAQMQTNPNPVLNPSGSSPARLAGDGRYFGYIRVASADPPTIRFDVAQFFFGKSVQRAAEQDGAVNPGEPVSNDHYERNRTPKRVMLKLDDDVLVTAAPPASILMPSTSRRARIKCYAAEREGKSCSQIPLSLRRFFRAAAEVNPRYGIPVWVTIRDRLVVRIDEQYFP
jgi:hypothetical protein